MLKCDVFSEEFADNRGSSLLWNLDIHT